MVDDEIFGDRQKLCGCVAIPWYYSRNNMSIFEIEKCYFMLQSWNTLDEMYSSYKNVDKAET